MYTREHIMLRIIVKVVVIFFFFFLVMMMMMMIFKKKIFLLVLFLSVDRFSDFWSMFARRSGAMSSWSTGRIFSGSSLRIWGWWTTWTKRKWSEEKRQSEKGVSVASLSLLVYLLQLMESQKLSRGQLYFQQATDRTRWGLTPRHGDAVPGVRCLSHGDRAAKGPCVPLRHQWTPS